MRLLKIFIISVIMGVLCPEASAEMVAEGPQVIHNSDQSFLKGSSPTAHSQTELIEAVSQKISFFLVYPEKAKENGWEGIAKIRFTVNEDGTIKDAQVEDSCGYPLLDKAALWAVQNASLYPFPLNREVSLALPIEFSTQTPSVQPLSATAPSAKAPSPESKRPLVVEKTKAQETAKTPQPTKKLFREEKKWAERAMAVFEKDKLDSLVSESFPEELKNIAKTALANNQPLQVAEEEIKLADIKIKEARRNLYAALNLQAYRTDGTANLLDYEEEEYKLNITQPIYYGGRLKNSLNQAEVNREITDRNYDQRMLDVIHKTEVAYYNLIALTMNVSKQEELIVEAEKLLVIIGRQHEEEVIISLDFKSAQSWYQQLQLLRDSIYQELEMAKLSLIQTMNVAEPPKVTTRPLAPRDFHIDLQECTETALIYRPEIYLAKLNRDFYDYGRKVERGKDTWNVDLTSYYGYYRGRMITEPTEDSDNWYVGIKAIKPWGASTLSTSYTKEEAQERFGETSPTATQTVSAEFGILDNYRKESDIQNAQVSFLKAESELNETEKSITFEIQDTFLNYKKALLELKSSLSMKDFKQENMRIVRIRASAGEDSFSNVMQALVDFSNAENTYLRALGNYYISVSKLRKGTGYAIRL